MIMSYNIPLMDSTEDNNQEQKMAQTQVPSLDKSGLLQKLQQKKERN